ncbi:hypothetical protein GFB56_37655 [Ensifer sp. T173]|uniref:Uncharacterized protein n=1 Tax=Ensifer canadensis TaxID=555315 RepID=A0AAW4FYL3_9HYPH|nr:hypothetical protein [Ensifer canadensis]MBM3096354.1 hypothetical protein [Ensifer canadensis]UBI80021.1 hypothetical protein J3R84_30900 [Ensifer canadensis]
MEILWYVPFSRICAIAISPAPARVAASLSPKTVTPALVDLYTVRPDGGGKQLLAKNGGKTENWIIGIDGVPRVRVDKAYNDDRIYMIRNSRM